MSPGRAGGAAPAIIAAIVLIATVLVGMSLRRPPLDTYAPTPIQPEEVGARLVGPLLHTVDASSPDRWRYFSFSLGSVVEDPGRMEWDLAFRRFQIIVNGGEGFAGSGGIIDLGARAFSEVRELPDQGYVGTVARSDSTNAAIARWYAYSWTSHVLSPEPRVYAIRTADGRYAKLELVSYYCPGAQPGCVTFRYTYQGAGGRDVAAGGAAPPASRSTPPVANAAEEAESEQAESEEAESEQAESEHTESEHAAPGQADEPGHAGPERAGPEPVAPALAGPERREPGWS